MKIPFKDIIRGLEESPSIDEVSKKLFQLGHEHEIIDNIFDFEFTPNRGDCLSLVGLLRELSIFYKLNNDLSFFEGEIDNLELDFINNATDICPQISFLYIEIDEEISEFNQEVLSFIILEIWRALNKNTSLLLEATVSPIRVFIENTLS